MLMKLVIALALFVVVLGQDYKWDESASAEKKPDSGYYDHTRRWEDYVPPMMSSSATTSVHGCIMVLMSAVIAWTWSK